MEDGQFLLPMTASLRQALDSFRRLSDETRIVVTDFSVTVLINNVDDKLTAVECEVVPPPSDVPLRYLLASYIQQPLPSDYLELDTDDFMITQGAPNNPRFPRPTDEEIFVTRHTHADFDRYTLVNSRVAVEQFFRWKASMQAKSKPVLVGTVLQAKSHGFQPRKHFRPRYPIESLPEDTLAHLRAVSRCSFPQFVGLLHRSQMFTLLLDEELTPSEGTGYARTFSCRIVTLDGKLLSDDVPSKFCLKLFDDGAASIPSHTRYPSLTMWSQNFYTAEDLMQNEIDVYNRLKFAWGSAVPQFYGAHSVSQLSNIICASLTLLVTSMTVYTPGWAHTEWYFD